MVQELTCADMAAVLGCSMRQLQRLAKAGTVPAVSGPPYMFDVAEAVQAYVAHVRGGGELTEDKARKLKAEADYREAKAKKEQLELDELKLKLHRSDDVKTCFEAFAAECRAAFLSLPGRVAVDGAEAATAAEVAAVVKREVDDTLNTLSRWQYDKDDYRRLVKEREKRELLPDEVRKGSTPRKNI